MTDNFDFNQIGQEFADAFGDSIKEPRLYLLGHPGKFAAGEGDPVRAVLGRDTDTPGMVWVHPMSVRIPGQPAGTSEESPRLVLNEGKGKIRDDDLIYGLPVHVRKEARSDVIDGTAPYPAAEYLHGVKVRPQRSIDLSQFDYMLLHPTNPASGGVIFTGGYPVFDNTVYQLLPRLIGNLVSTFVPGLDDGEAVAVMIEIDPVLNSFAFTNGDVFNHSPATGLPEHSGAFATYYPQEVDTGRYLLGWVRFYAGMSTIVQQDIFPAQEVVSKSRVDFDSIVTSEGHVVVDNDGNVVLNA